MKYLAASYRRTRLRFWASVSRFVNRRLHRALIDKQIPRVDRRQREDKSAQRIRSPFQ